MDAKIERLTRPVVSLVTALAALVGSCTALYKAVDKTVERKSYETTVKAIEDLRKENEELRKSLSTLHNESLIDVLDVIDLSAPKLGSTSSSAVAASPSASPSSSSSASTPATTVAIASSGVTISATPWHIKSKAHPSLSPSAAPTMAASAARPRPPLPAWSDL